MVGRHHRHDRCVVEKGREHGDRRADASAPVRWLFAAGPARTNRPIKVISSAPVSRKTGGDHEERSDRRPVPDWRSPRNVSSAVRIPSATVREKRAAIMMRSGPANSRIIATSVEQDDREREPAFPSHLNAARYTNIRHTVRRMMAIRERRTVRPAAQFSEKGFYLGEFRGRTLDRCSGFGEPICARASRSRCARCWQSSSANATRVVLISDRRRTRCGSLLAHAGGRLPDTPRGWKGRDLAASCASPDLRVGSRRVDAGANFARREPRRIALRLGVTEARLDRWSTVRSSRTGGSRGCRSSIWSELHEPSSARRPATRPGRAAGRCCARSRRSWVQEGLPAVNLCSARGSRRRAVHLYGIRNALLSASGTSRCGKLGIDDFDGSRRPDRTRCRRGLSRRPRLAGGGRARAGERFRCLRRRPLTWRGSAPCCSIPNQDSRSGDRFALYDHPIHRRGHRCVISSPSPCSRAQRTSSCEAFVIAVHDLGARGRVLLRAQCGFRTRPLRRDSGGEVARLRPRKRRSRALCAAPDRLTGLLKNSSRQARHGSSDRSLRCENSP